MLFKKKKLCRRSVSKGRAALGSILIEAILEVQVDYGARNTLFMARRGEVGTGGGVILVIFCVKILKLKKFYQGSFLLPRNLCP